jgi:hypothetical protein
LQAATMSLRILALIILIITPSILLVEVASQTPAILQPGFNQALLEVRKAEADGATASEMNDLVGYLNRALNLNRQALALTSPSDAQQRTKLLAQVDQDLSVIRQRAGVYQIEASQRTFWNHVLAYLAGGVAALLATFAYALILAFYRRYRVKRTMQMKISPK